MPPVQNHVRTASLPIKIPETYVPSFKSQLQLQQRPSRVSTRPPTRLPRQPPPLLLPQNSHLPKTTLAINLDINLVPTARSVAINTKYSGTQELPSTKGVSQSFPIFTKKLAPRSAPVEVKDKKIMTDGSQLDFLKMGVHKNYSLSVSGLYKEKEIILEPRKKEFRNSSSNTMESRASNNVVRPPTPEEENIAFLKDDVAGHPRFPSVRAVMIYAQEEELEYITLHNYE